MVREKYVFGKLLLVGQWPCELQKASCKDKAKNMHWLLIDNFNQV